MNFWPHSMIHMIPDSGTGFCDATTWSDNLSAGMEELCWCLQSEVDALRKERDVLQEKVWKLTTSAERLDDTKCRLFSGIPSVPLFMFIVSLVSNLIPDLKSTSIADQVLPTLMKLCLGLKNADPALWFGISSTTLSKIINHCVPVLATHLWFLIHWPLTEKIECNLPKSFKKKYKNCQVIINCSEIFTERLTVVTFLAYH